DRGRHQTTQQGVDRLQQPAPVARWPRWSAAITVAITAPVNRAPRHFSRLARRLGEPPISWLMKVVLDRPDLISLAAGFTDNETLPVEEVAGLTREILSRPKTARASLQYGTMIA